MLFQKWAHSSFAGGVLPRWLFYHVPLLESIDLGLRGSKSRLSLSLINMTSPSCAVFSCFLILRSLLAGTLFFLFFSVLSFVIQRYCTLLVCSDWLIVSAMVSCIDGMVGSVSHEMMQLEKGG